VLSEAVTHLEDRFLKKLSISIFLGEVVRGGGCPPLSKIVGYTPWLMIVKRFHKGNADAGQPTVIKVRK
jgi:hypothetical protein